MEIVWDVIKFSLIGAAFGAGFVGFIYAVFFTRAARYVYLLYGNEKICIRPITGSTEQVRRSIMLCMQNIPILIKYTLLPATGIYTEN